MCVIGFKFLLLFLMTNLQGIISAPVVLLHEMLPMPQRIINGKEIYIYDHPYLVYLAVAATNELLCGGSIVNKWSILTAGHCVHEREMDQVTAVAGYNRESRHMQFRGVSSVTIHPEYVDRTKNNKNGSSSSTEDKRLRYIDFDFAIVHLDEPLAYTLAVHWIELAQTMTDIDERTEMLAMGWGGIKPKRSLISNMRGGGGVEEKVEGEVDERRSRRRRRRKLITPTLKGVVLHIVDLSECQRNYSEIRVAITDRFFCAASRKGDTCQGDSGGPIVVNNVQYGIISFAEGCFREGFPTVFAKIPTVYDWIMVTAGGLIGSVVSGWLLYFNLIFIFCF